MRKSTRGSSRRVVALPSAQPAGRSALLMDSMTEGIIDACCHRMTITLCRIAARTSVHRPVIRLAMRARRLVCGSALFLSRRSAVRYRAYML